MRFLNPQCQKFHPTLINIGLKLGHYLDPIGICMGICSAGNVAIVTGDMQLFNARLKKIFSLHSQHLSQSLDNEEEAIQQTAQVIEKDIDLRSFFDTLVSFQQNLNANYLSSLKDGSQKIFSDEEIYSLAGSIKLEMKGGIQSFNLACGIYNFWDFKTHLELLCKYFNDHHEDFCNKHSPYLAVNLETPNHVISFGYDVFKKEFILNDSNFLPLKTLKNLDELSEILYRSLTKQFIVFPLDPFKHLMLNSKVISLKKEGRLPPKFEPTSSCNLRRIFESRFIDPKTQQTLLIAAPKYGYTDLVISLIQSRADVNHREVYGTSALMIAIQKGHKEIVKTLLAANVDVNQADLDGFTPLMTAVHQGHQNIVRILLSSKANINQTNNAGCTALMLVAEKGQSHIVKDLIDAGADVNFHSLKNVTSLMIAAQNNHVDTVDLLLRAQAHMNARDILGRTPLILSTISNNIEIVKKLILAGAMVST